MQFPRKLRPTKAKATQLILHVILLAYSFIVLYPIGIMLLSSVKNTREIFMDPYGWPKILRWDNFSRAWRIASFSAFFKNSFFVSIMTVVVLLFISSMAAYVLARFEFRGNGILYMIFISGLMLPIRLAVVPIFTMMRDVRLLDTRTSLMIVYVASGIPFSIFLLVNFFKTIPKEIEEAAIIDGCTPFSIYYRIMLPLIRPALATVGIYNFIGTWNDFFFPLVFLRTESKYTIPLGIMKFFGEYSNQWDMLFASLTIAIIPIIVIFLFASNQFIKGMTAGAVKN